jgi:hypothetical protein
MLGFFIAVGHAFQWIGSHIKTELEILHVWGAITAIWNAIRVAGKFVNKLGGKIWGALQTTYERVLKPAWQKFYKFVDRVHDWLDRHLGPLLKKVNDLRKKIYGYWKRFVRPVLDFIDALRGVLRVLAALHVPFAKKLDAELGRIEGWITRVFTEIFQRLNEVSDWLDRIIGLDGLFKRLTLLRSLVANIGNVWSALVNSYTKPIDQATRDELKTSMKGRTLTVVRTELHEYYATSGGPAAPRIQEAAAQWALYFTAT